MKWRIFSEFDNGSLHDFVDKKVYSWVILFQVSFLLNRRSESVDYENDSSSSEENYDDDDYSLIDDSKKDSDYIPELSDQENSDNMFEKHSADDKVPSENLEDAYVSDSSCSSDASEIIMPIALPALQPNRKRNSEIDDCKVSSSV